MTLNPPQPQNKQTKKVYFFSDVHLGDSTTDENRRRERHVVSFLNQVLRDGEQLYIVGDLFDYWFEYQSVVPKGYVRLMGKLAELSDRGIKITYLAGNHDFWMKDYLTKELGIEINRDPIERVINGKKFYIIHGDGLSEKDSGYRLLKRILRNKTNIYLFSLLHPDLASRLARWSSRKSRKHSGNKQIEEQEMMGFARKKIQEGFDFVIMGHNHKGTLRSIGKGIYVNLGDWISENSFAIFDGKSMQLRRWHYRAKAKGRRWNPHRKMKPKTHAAI